MEVTPAEIGQPERRSVRRRLVQSTLFPHKPEEPEDNGDRKDEKDFVDDDEYYGNERRKKRKAKTKPVSPAKVSKKLSKEKQSTNLTPKKSILSKLNGDTSPSMPDLRLEAKMTAEENSRMFAGKQQHPFFSSLRTGKKSQEANAMVDDCYPAKRKNKGISCGPIHVFESTEDEVIYLDWRNWVLTEDNGVTSGSHGLESNFTSIFYRSCKSLSLDELPTVSHPCEAFFIQDRCLDQSVVEQEHTHHISPPVSSMDADSRVTSVLLLDGTELDCKHYRVSEHSDCEAVWNIKCQSILQERMRPTKDGVWTHEYRPKKATEVCGNRDSVKFLNEWLRLWYERNSQTSKDFTGRDKCDMQDNDLYCTHSASDSESTEEEDSLKNVLLLTGPAGSGKSAAIYACAKDQGFRVSEINASVERSGAILREMIGEILKSHQLKWPFVNPLESRDSLDFVGGLGDFVLEKEGCEQGEVKPLILLEDVDIIFPEDRGFIAAVQEIVDTGKGPIILTSNSDNPTLPDNLSRLKVSFELPSSDELVCHLHTICATEGVSIQPQLVEQFIGCFQGDIRKSITNLQFWFQGERFGADRKAQSMGSSLLFDLDAGHQILPRAIPWGFPSQLSELIEKEIARSLSMMQESSSLVDEMEEEFENMELQTSMFLHKCKKDTIEAKKVAMLRENGTVHDYNDFTGPFKADCGYSNMLDAPVEFCRRNPRRKLDMVVFSDSEEDLINNERSIVPDKDANGEPGLDLNELPSPNPESDELLCPREENIDGDHKLSPETSNKDPTNGPFHELNKSSQNPAFDKLLCPRAENLERDHSVCSETENKDANGGPGLELNKFPSLNLEFMLLCPRAGNLDRDHNVSSETTNKVTNEGLGLDLNKFPCLNPVLELLSSRDENLDGNHVIRSEAANRGVTDGLRIEINKLPCLNPAFEPLCPRPENLDGDHNFCSEAANKGTTRGLRLELNRFPCIDPPYSGVKKLNGDHNFCSEPAKKDIINRAAIEKKIPSLNLPFELLCPAVENSDTDHNLCSETADYMNETCKSVDISRVPESTYVPETAIENETELSPETISSGDSAEIRKVSESNELTEMLLSVGTNCLDNPPVDINLASDVLGNNCEVLADSSYQEGEENCPDEHVEAITGAYQVMDECSRMDFNRSEKPMIKVLSDLVQESWKKLRVCHADLRHHVTLEKQEVCQIVDLAHKISNIISDYDLLLSYCEPQGSYETLRVLPEELDFTCWCDEQLQMASTTTEHGFCLYTRDIAGIGSTMGCEINVDIAAEMLASSTNTVSLDKLRRHGKRDSKDSPARKKLETVLPNSDSMLQSETRSHHCRNIIPSIIPTRSYLGLKGLGSVEYLSSLRHISKSEASRLTEGNDKRKMRRGRLPRHYLSSGSLMLSPEDIELLDQSTLP